MVRSARVKPPASLVASVLLFACGGAAPPTPTAPAAPPASSAPAPAAPPETSTTPSDLKAPGEATVGDRTRCPVSGDDFTVSAESPHVEYQGKLYYFCCPNCPQKFLANPAKYLGKPST